MRREIEIKLPVHDARALRRRLAELGFHRASRRYFERNALLDFPGRVLRKKGSLLRLRLESGRGLLTFKGPRIGSGRFKERVEIEARLQHTAEMTGILEALGLEVAFRYEKYRTLYRRRSDPLRAEVAFDETPIGVYLEIEGPRRWIDQVARGLGYGQRDYITASYGRLYLGWCRTHRLKSGDMVFRHTPVGAPLTAASRSAKVLKSASNAL
ncbi:MAG TPA: class IV adenylate cyclase [Terriglobia bacterium]|nr:class IV adenylate cyclase [Terriglobia bacterium]